jgi:hypothetical protein
MNQWHWQLARGGFDEKKIIKSHEAVPIKCHAELCLSNILFWLIGAMLVFIFSGSYVVELALVRTYDA